MLARSVYGPRRREENRLPRVEPGAPPRIVCIAGYGRSGSTLLQKLLESHPEVHSLGEVAYLFDVWKTPLARCSCGADPCPWWAGVIDRFAALGYPESRFRAVRALLRSVEGWRSRLPRVPHAVASSAEGAAYAEAVSSLFSAVLSQVRGQPVWIDSSKTSYPSAYRPFALRHLLGYDVRVVHIVRDLRGVIQSVRKGRNQRMELGKSGGNAFPALRGIVGWKLANEAAERHRELLGADRYLLVRYEDFVADPPAVLETIGAFAGVGPGAFVHEGDAPFRPSSGHPLSGNRMRFQNEIVVTPRGRPSLPLGRVERLLVHALVRRQMIAYGYAHSNG